MWLRLLASVYYRATTLLKCWSNIDFSPQNIHSKTASTRYIFQKNLRWSLFTVELQSVYCKLVTLLKQTPRFQTWKSIIFSNIFIWFEKSNYIKDHMKVRRKAKGKGRLFQFFHWMLLNIENMLEKNLRTKQYTQYTRLWRSS